MVQFSKKIDRNILGTKIFDPKLTWPKLFQTERTLLYTLSKHCEFISKQCILQWIGRWNDSKNLKPEKICLLKYGWNDLEAMKIYSPDMNWNPSYLMLTWDIFHHTELNIHPSYKSKVSLSKIVGSKYSEIVVLVRTECTFYLPSPAIFYGLDMECLPRRRQFLFLSWILSLTTGDDLKVFNDFVTVTSFSVEYT